MFWARLNLLLGGNVLHIKHRYTVDFFTVSQNYLYPKILIDCKIRALKIINGNWEPPRRRQLLLLFYCLSAKLASIITKMKLQNIEKTKKKRKKRKNKTDTIKLIRKRANVQLNSNPKEALAIKRRKCKGPFLGPNTGAHCANKTSWK